MPSYRFYDIELKNTPKQSYIDDFEAMFDLALENAPNYFDNIKQELVPGSKVFYTTEGRVDSVVDPNTGKNAGDDYKLFILRPEQPKQFVGKLFFWEDSYWLTENTNSYETLSNYCIVKRCHNVLKWIDSNGILREEPCSMGYDIYAPKDFTAKEYKLPSGQITLQTQKNIYTDFIDTNMRFLFGTKQNRKAYKIFGGGIVNYLNRNTFEDDSTSVLSINLGSDYLNSETDDIENGIADAYINAFEVKIDQDDIFQGVGFIGNLTATTYRNGQEFTGTVLWSSSDTSVCTIDGDGEYELLKEGTAVITAKLSTNLTITDTVEVEVSDVPVEDYDIRLTPNYFNISEGDEVTYSCYLFLNEVQQADVFEFTVVGSDVPNYKYNITIINGNSFKIKNNNMHLENNLVIGCISTIHMKEFEFKLRGVF